MRFLLVSVILTFVIPIGGQWRYEPLWISTMNDAENVGLDLDRFLRLYCTPFALSRRIHYVNMEDIHSNKTEQADHMLRQYAYIAVVLESLCFELELQFPTIQENQMKKTNATADNSTTFELSEESGSVGINLDLLGEKNLESLEKAKTDDLEMDQILRQFEKMSRTGQKPFASTFILPLMKKLKYDPRIPPMASENHTVIVRTGLHVQSVSNFELTTMVINLKKCSKLLSVFSDYDLDAYVRLAWRDPRLAHGLSAPILFTEESYLRRLWRPDAVFINSMESLFHRVTFLNFYIFVFPEGEVFFEARVYIKATSQLCLQKFPHDWQTLYVRISSIAMTTINFRWFPLKRDAIRVNRNLQLPEFTIISYDTTTCDARRKTGNFTCLEARFKLKRNIGFHLAQTYAPTAMCVLFSWISVWLPEEFVEGRVFVSLTVFLTLSAESNAAKETLPKVSYVKSIDIWFGFTASFVFATMLQALLRQMVERHGEILGVDKSLRLLMESKRMHQLGRWLDENFKVLYPCVFIIFLFYYAFVEVQGDPICT
ncbi:hypothetical protein M3Y96_01049800 [Aphelenchoides besseyi]|nr:hypothetical protein M3Y96_01049800 [Aphelenchoides besseyi]